MYKSLDELFHRDATVIVTDLEVMDTVSIPRPLYRHLSVYEQLKFSDKAEAFTIKGGWITFHFGRDNNGNG